MQSATTSPGGTKQTRGRRKKLFINPGFQWRYAMAVSLGVFVIATIMCFAMYGVLYQQARTRVLYLAPTSTWENTYSMILFAGVFAATMSAAFGLWSVIVSQRMCGPMFVMRGYLDQVAEGRFPKMRDLRKRDEFKEFFETLRGAVNRLRVQGHANLQTVNDALHLIDTVQNGEETVRAQALSALRNRLESLQEGIAHAIEADLPATTYDVVIPPPANADAAATDRVGARA